MVFGINMIQHDDISIETNADEIEELSTYSISSHQRHEINDPISPLERQSFESIN